MREIKFRGKRCDNNEWSYGELSHGLFSGNSFVDGLIITGTVGQYTGLKDKNGVEIYEGDVLKHESENIVVSFEQRTAQFTAEGRWLWSILDKAEVIGNIIDNPELMEEFKKMNQERWAEIKGYEGMYLISDHGRVLSLERERSNGVSSYIQKERVLKQSLTTTGYKKVDLRKNNTKKTFKVHRLVGIAFVENPDGKPQINHKDGNPLNNHYTNLEWTTQAENVRHALEMGLKPSFRISAETLGHLHHNKEMSVSEIAEKYQVTPGTIYKKMKEENVRLEPSAKYRIRTSWLKEQFENRRTNKDIAKEVGCAPSLISHYKKRIETKGKIYG